MTKRPDQHGREELRRRLRDWDPAARFAEPDPARLQAMRARLRRAASGGPRRSPWRVRRAVWAAAAGAAMLALVVVTGERRDHVPEAADSALARKAPGGVSSDGAAERTRMELTASNGVRIYWTVERGPQT